ncbi:MAG TPA: hypothetical protein VIP82_11260 [Microbacterium sp.]
MATLQPDQRSATVTHGGTRGHRVPAATTRRRLAIAVRLADER